MQLYDGLLFAFGVQTFWAGHGVGQAKPRQSGAAEPSGLQQLDVREGATHLVRQIPRLLYGAGGWRLELQLQRSELLCEHEVHANARKPERFLQRSAPHHPLPGLRKPG